jgi:hypothetical protein
LEQHILDPWYSRMTRFLKRVVGEERMVRILQYTLYPLEGALNRFFTRDLGSARKGR